jgi:3-hydroxyisobutyrate dehydrogenase-like beta-hydroxyacid dehydrogenase
MANPVIGFVGVGYMGEGMASNLLAKGYPLVVLAHRNRAPIERLCAQGAREAASLAELAAQCDIIHLCVTGSPQVEQVVLGEGGILSHARPGTIVIDTSTSDPVSTLAIDARLRSAGLHLVDAPLGGTPREAAAGTLSAMVGADDAVFARVQPVIACWAATINHLGAVGLGHKMKLLNNFLSLGYGALYAEALALARKAGISVAQFHQVIGSGRMRCGFYDTFMKWTVEGDEQAHLFTIDNAHKDMRYCSNMANALGAVTPIQSLVRAAYASMAAAGEGGRFVPMVAGHVARQNGLPERPAQIQQPEA